jgi:hypothetical protein
VSGVSHTRGILQETRMVGAMNTLFRYDGDIPLYSNFPGTLR